MEAQVFLQVAPLALFLKQCAHAKPASELRLKTRHAAMRMIYSIHSIRLLQSLEDYISCTACTLEMADGAEVHVGDDYF